MVELNSIEFNSNFHKFAIRIMEMWDLEILTISWGMILREKVVKIVDTHT